MLKNMFNRDNVLYGLLNITFIVFGFMLFRIAYDIVNPNMKYYQNDWAVFLLKEDPVLKEMRICLRPSACTETLEELYARKGWLK